MKVPLIIFLSLTALSGKTVDVYFGTGTTPEAIGIFHAKFDTESGTLGERTLAAQIKEPEFLALHPKERNQPSQHILHTFQGFVSNFFLEANTIGLYLRDGFW